MSKTEEQGKVPPLPLDEDGNPIGVDDGSNTKTSTAPTIEELMKKLEKLNAELKKLKAKDKKGKNHSSSSKDDDSSFEKEVCNKGKKERKKRDKSSYNAISFNYDTCLALPLILPYLLAKLHILMGLTIINGSIA
jgi:predicted RNase H-like nuclease (RuvC/YqgF family)